MASIEDWWLSLLTHVERALPLLGQNLGFPWWEFGVAHDDQRYQIDVTVCFMTLRRHLASYERV